MTDAASVHPRRMRRSAGAHLGGDRPMRRHRAPRLREHSAPQQHGTDLSGREFALLGFLILVWLAVFILVMQVMW